MSLQLLVTRKMSWYALSVIAWSIVGVGSVLADPSSMPVEDSMPVEELILEDAIEALSKDASPVVRPAPLAPLEDGLSTIGLDFEMSRLYSGSNFIPPDTMGAVGPDHIVELINVRYEAYDKKTGLELESFSLNGFWTTVVGLDIPQDNICQGNGICALSGKDCSAEDPCDKNFTFDPRIIYDWQTGRWFALSIDAALGQDNDFYLGRSDGSNPLGSWAGVKFDSDTVGPTEFHDYPTFSVDADAVTTCTQDINSGSGGGGAESCYTIPKADVLLSPPSVANMTRFESTPPNLPPVNGSIQPALSFEPAADGITPLLGVIDGMIVRGDILGAGAAGATLAPTGGITGDPGHHKPPPARQPAADPGATIENVAPHFVANVVEIGDSLWAVHAVAGTLSNSALRWYRIAESTDILLQTGLIEDVNEDYHEPSIAVNALGRCGDWLHLLRAQPRRQCVHFRGETIGGVTTFEPTPQLTTPGGRALYFRTFGGTRNRWGDYSATVVDPDDECTFWTMQEFVAVGRPR